MAKTNANNGEKKSARRNGGIPGKGTRPKNSRHPKMSPVEKLMAKDLPYAVLVRKLNNLGLHYNSAVATK